MATSVWYNPDNWNSGLVRNKRFNEQIKANLKYLSERNIELDFETRLFSTVSPNLVVTHTNTTGLVIVHFKGTVVSNSVASDAYVDIQITLGGGAGTIYASSGTGTPASRGCFMQRQVTANIETEMIFTIPVIVPAGTHTYAPAFAVTAGTASYGGHYQIIVEEYGLGLTNLRNWVEPKTWNAGENVTVDKLDNYVKERMKFLYDRNWVHYKEVPAGTITTLSTTFVPITADNRFNLRLLTTGNDVLLRMLFSANHGAAGASGYVDVLVDDDYYVSSLTDTALTDGISNTSYPTGAIRSSYFETLLTNIDAGWHTFEPHIKSSVGSFNFTIQTLTPVLFMAEEYCLTSK